VRLIRWGNAFDDKEFERRENEFQNPTAGGVISMAPPPNREDELHSRAEYYHSYTREYFVQESDCLDNDPLQERDIRRYLYYLRKGEKDRKWLLGDMMFPDPYKNFLDQDRINGFEAMSKKYFGEEEEEEEEHSILFDDDNTNNGATSSSSSSSSSSNDGFIEDDDPDWFQKVSKNDEHIVDTELITSFPLLCHGGEVTARLIPIQYSIIEYRNFRSNEVLLILYFNLLTFCSNNVIDCTEIPSSSIKINMVLYCTNSFTYFLI